MAAKGQGHEHKHQAPQGFTFPSAHSSDAGVNNEGRRQEDFPASEVMTLALELTQTSAEVYEIIAEMAESLAGPPKGDVTTARTPFPRHLAHLRGITEAIDEAESHLRELESKTVTIRPEILELFLEDCWAALTTFKEVRGLLAGIVELDGSAKPSTTALEILSRIMQHLDNCSKEVSGLTVAGLAVSSQCLAETAINLQNRAGKLAG